MDARRRESERSAALGDEGARAQLLAERVRAGDLDRERLRLAAALGDEAAAMVLGDEAPRHELEPHRWVVGIETTRLLRQVLMSLADSALPLWQGALPRAPQPVAALEALGSWLSAPSESTWAEVERARAGLDAAIEALQAIALCVAAATEDRLPTLAEIESALDAGLRTRFDAALVTLDLTGAQVLEVVGRFCQGPQGEATFGVLVTLAFSAPRLVLRLLERATAADLEVPSARTGGDLGWVGFEAQRVARHSGGTPALCERLRRALLA